MRRVCSAIADKTSAMLGHPLGSLGMFIGCLLTLVWGYIAHYNTLWSAWLGALTGLVSLQLLVLLQHSQSKGDRATHIKLDEIIFKMDQADNRLVGLEDDSEGEIRASQDAIREAADKTSHDTS